MNDDSGRNRDRPQTPSRTTSDPYADQAEESILRLLVSLPLAALKMGVGKLSPLVVGLVLTICGLILILSPLALWISWTITIFNAVLGLAILALVIAFCLITLAREDQL